MSAPSVEAEHAGPIAAPNGSLLGDSIVAWRDRTRRELGIGGRGPVVGAGHQPGLWHPGILAKFIHARGLAGSGGTVVHVVVDHDAVDPSLVRVPLRRDGRLAAVSHRFGPAARGEAAMAIPPFAPRAFEGAAALPSVDAGLARAVRALEAARGEASAAMQVATATGSLMRRWSGEAPIVPTSRFLGTTFGAVLVDAMARDPRRCAEAFNQALRADAHAASPLRIDDDPELPLWTLDENGRRRRTTRSMLDGAPSSAARSDLLPRAFLVGAFMRIALLDRAVHGLGARRYERVTEAWFRAWLGVELPPIDVASATLTLPLRPDDAMAAAPPPESRSALRRGWWDPESLDGAEGRPASPGPRKRALLEEMARLPRRSPARREAHRRLRRLLDSLRAERSGALAELRERQAVDRRLAEEAALTADRTWPFVYFEDASLDALASLLARGSGTASGSGR